MPRILLLALLGALGGCSMFSTVSDQWFFAGDPMGRDWPGLATKPAPRHIDLAADVRAPYTRRASQRTAIIPAGRLDYCGYDKRGDYSCSHAPVAIGGDSKAGGLYVPRGGSEATAIFWHVSFREMEYARQCLRSPMTPAMPVTVVTDPASLSARPPAASPDS